jgi:hypothetical protein
MLEIHESRIEDLKLKRDVIVHDEASPMESVIISDIQGDVEE